MNYTKENERQAIVDLYYMGGFFRSGVTKDDLFKMLGNITNDKPLFLGTAVGDMKDKYYALSESYDNAVESLTNATDMIEAYKDEKKKMMREMQALKTEVIRLKVQNEELLRLRRKTISTES